MLKLVLLSVLAVSSSMFCFNLSARSLQPQWTAKVASHVQQPLAAENVYREEGGQSIRSRILENRIIFLHSKINEALAFDVNAQLHFLNSEDQDDIKLYINSPGGEIYHALSIYDTMQHIEADVCTFGMGICASAASFLLASGADGKRVALPNTRIMIHQPLGGARGQETDVEIQAAELKYLKGSLNELLAKHTGQTVEQILADTDRDNYMSAEEAVDYGLIDSVLEPKSD